MNDRIHPVFAPILSEISMNDPYPTSVPCRVSADLRRHQSEQNQLHDEPPGFDEWDNDLFHDLCGKRQGPVVQDLLILLSQVDATKDSFGVNGDRFMKMAIPMLQKLREACLDDFKEM